MLVVVCVHETCMTNESSVILPLRPRRGPAEDCACTFSTSKQPDKIRFSDGKTVEAGPLLRAKLTEFGKAKP